MPETEDREKRKKPGSSKPIMPPEIELPLPRLVAPSLMATKNTIRFLTWVEIRLVNDHDKPIVDEKVCLYRADGVVLERKTDQDGVARFDDLPLFLTDLSVIQEDVYQPAVFFPDILEEHKDKPPGEFGKNDGARDDHRKHDGVVHFVRAEQARFTVKIASLTEEEKLQHFVHAYVDNAARYQAASPGDYKTKEKRWSWGKGAVCNQHVNFFLGFWFNYDASFSASGSGTAMTCLPLYSSERHDFGSTKHRGYLEFLAPVNGYGAAFDTVYSPADPSAIPAPKSYGKAYRHVEYIRMSKYFDKSTGAPRDTDEAKAFVSALGKINVYSVADNNKAEERKSALDAARAYLKKHKAELGLTDKQIEGKTDGQLWEFIWDLDDADAGQAALIKALRGYLNYDHHAGILLKRAKGGGPLTGAEGEEVELWTFSADGSLNSVPGPVIVMKKFADVVKGTKSYSLAIWSTRALRDGGYAPAVENAGKVDTEEPPRFIHWG